VVYDTTGNGILIENAINPTFNVPGIATGAADYYAIITDNGATGTPIEIIQSNAISVFVSNAPAIGGLSGTFAIDVGQTASLTVA